MNYVKWTLDLEDGELKPFDLLGTITIIGDRGQIEDRCTYLDAFFEALVKGIQYIERKPIIEIDTLVEPDDIIFDCTGKNLVINYGKQQATIFNEKKFLKNVKEAIEKLLNTIDDETIATKEAKPILDILRSFLHIIN
jgi:hypothetical protein